MGLAQPPKALIPIDSKRTPDPKTQLKALLGQVLLEDGIGALMGLIAEITQQSESTRRSSNIA
jgi:hypothetical protein